ncbi:predicted protein [Uncinocarpus reesii 1704]|uniref:Uncharacterized protein n=1 Tax=Uncinocarpus reesii (strain UAMH 1704) TaxID=336963 RepID=C4JLW7_UNCRE|nr:uncharacterized protein UREG_03825 [Uncinocarpus reesii 1704]EEP78979.1 predicted protein [Uncinocarpus reesii 1704]
MFNISNGSPGFGPGPLRFLFKIDFIKPNYDEQSEIRIPDQKWIPPTIPQAITTVGTTGWFQWSSNGVNPAMSTSETDFQVCSLFYNSEHSHFQGVPFDCRKYSVKESRMRDGIGWRRVMFRYSLHSSRLPISIMGFDSAYNVLAGKGSSSWMPQLIPETYDNNQDENCSEHTGIAGDLALLLAFVAFSYTINPQDPNMVLWVIHNCFKPPVWNRHPCTAPRKHGTGVVVSIRLDPESNITAEDLRNYQKGYYGPFIQP